MVVKIVHFQSIPSIGVCSRFQFYLIFKLENTQKLSEFLLQDRSSAYNVALIGRNETASIFLLRRIYRSHHIHFDPFKISIFTCHKRCF